MSSRAFDAHQSAQSILAVQTEYGAIPWWPGGRLDVWNHVESAMALDACGFAREAEAAYRWLAAIQRTDGAWCAAYVDGRPTDATLDANFVAYVAAGCHHHFLHTRDIDFLIEMWPTVEPAIEFVLALQLPSGEIAWARDAAYRAWPAGLRTSSACIYLSLRSAIAIAGELGLAKPEWELAAESLRASVARGDREFIPKDNFSMDWYYPVLAGALRGEAARRRLNEGWATFVIEGRGVRCVSERPWVTAGESAELVIALSVAGYDERAELVFDWLQHLRTPTGSYWTGATWPDGTVWPREAPTWCAGAVILADASLNPRTPTHGLFGVSQEAVVNLDAAQRLADPL